MRGFGLDQAVLKDEGIRPVGNARPRGVASPLNEEYIVRVVDGLVAPLCSRKSFEKAVEEMADGVLATPDTIRGDQDGRIATLTQLLA